MTFRNQEIVEIVLYRPKIIIAVELQDLIRMVALKRESGPKLKIIKMVILR
jgi:hypothetical protein